jgi:hypothetical protein
MSVASFPLAGPMTPVNPLFSVARPVFRPPSQTLRQIAPSPSGDLPALSTGSSCPVGNSAAVQKDLKDAADKSIGL